MRIGYWHGTGVERERKAPVTDEVSHATLLPLSTRPIMRIPWVGLSPVPHTKVNLKDLAWIGKLNPVNIRLLLWVSYRIGISFSFPRLVP